jgi:hypothetical protein
MNWISSKNQVKYGDFLPNLLRIAQRLMEKHMQKLRAALLGTALAAIPLTFALAASPSAAPVAGMVVYDAAGQPIGVLAPLPGMQPAQTPLAWGGDDGDMFLNPARIFAEQEAMMRRISQEMDAAMLGLNRATQQTIQAAFQHGASLPDGTSQLVITSFSSGNGSCSQTVTYSYPGPGAQPKVAVQKVGDACGTPTQQPLRSVPAADAPATPPAVAPNIAPDGSRLIRADYRHTPTPEQFHG